MKVLMPRFLTEGADARLLTEDADAGFLMKVLMLGA